MNYLIDFFLLASRLNVVNKRKPIHQSWVNVFMKPMNTINNSFFGVYLVDVRNRSKRTGQKIVLEGTLNELFNPGNSRKISIDNSGDDLANSYFYNESEGYPAQFLYNESEGEQPFYLYNESEYQGLGDFVVFVPTEVLNTFSLAQISAEVDKYRPAGTKFSIITY
ncbi:MAG: hypothetical protein GY822_19085 [Deltaproteobacteria bacterium]|nr:hypothetical protein [Deltaproteobacteria bacterium]